MKQSLMADAKKGKLGLYFSIPFCRSKCTYCNFASGVYPASEHERYVERLVEDLTHATSWANQMGVVLPETVDTVYLGGGTPSLLAPSLFERLFAAIRTRFHLEEGAEITVECAPGQLSDATLEILPRLGVNRISLGVQSFVDREAQVSGRLHKRVTILNDLKRLRAMGVTNLNVDLIAGLPGQTLSSWEESLAALLESGVPHASVYMLEVDEESRLGKELLDGGARYYAELVPADDAIALLYEIAIERLEKAGLRQYEISNFARRDSKSKHNLRYWQRRPYLGLGLDASSALESAPEAEKNGQRKTSRYVLRSKTTDDLKEYLAGPQPVETAWLSPERQYEEAWFLGLRLNAGVKLVELRREFGAEFMDRALQVVHGLSKDDLVVTDGKTVRLTAKGRLISNEVFQQFLTAADSDVAMEEPVLR